MAQRTTELKARRDKYPGVLGAPDDQPCPMDPFSCIIIAGLVVGVPAYVLGIMCFSPHRYSIGRLTSYTTTVKSLLRHNLPPTSVRPSNATSKTKTLIFYE